MGVRVEGIKCPCPGTPHPDGDWVELHSRPTVAIGAAVNMAIALHGNTPIMMQGVLMEAEVLHGIVAWSFVDVDAKGRQTPVPVNRDMGGWADTVNRLLPFGGGGYAVAQKADELYSKEVLDPLVQAISKSLGNGQQPRLTSPTRPSGAKRPRRSKPSLQLVSDGKQSAALGH